MSQIYDSEDMKRIEDDDSGKDNDGNGVKRKEETTIINIWREEKMAARIIQIIINGESVYDNESNGNNEIYSVVKENK